MIDDGKIEMQGNMQNMKEFEVRLAAAKEEHLPEVL